MTHRLHRLHSFGRNWRTIFSIIIIGIENQIKRNKCITLPTFSSNPRSVHVEFETVVATREEGRSHHADHATPSLIEGLPAESRRLEIKVAEDLRLRFVDFLEVSGCK